MRRLWNPTLLVWGGPYSHDMKIAKIASVTLLALSLAACGQEVTNTDESPKNSANSSSSTSAESSSASASDDGASSGDSSAEPSEESSESSSLTKKFGSTFTWDDKVAVTVSEPKLYTPSESAAVDGSFKKFVVVEIVLKNGSDKPYSPGSDFMTSATTGDVEADRVYDSGNGVDSPMVDVLPGKSLKWKEAYGVNESGDLVLKVENGFGNAAGYYQK